MNKMNYKKYKPFPVIDITDRQWPDQTITEAPIWCSVDLRDGNQALSKPMDIGQKIAMFEMLVEVGFKEIEVGFPSASEVEYNFMRRLIEENRIPDDVCVQVLVQSREHLIKKTFDSLKGVKHAIVHLYNPTSTLQRRVVFNKSKDEIKNVAVTGTEIIKSYRQKFADSDIRLEYSPESFSGTEVDFALDVCHSVMDVWGPNSQNKIIINLPNTVEMATPNIYADQIEWMCRNIRERENVIVSLHSHNDRGTGVAATELALMAGANRVEGTVFGNGERTGNLDIVNMALNMFSQGVDPELDFSDINRIRDIYMKCTGMAIHSRHPYAGELVYTAFSGSHQDAINKGMHAYQKSGNGHWEVPYLPIDPKDVGRCYESIIRINSQSGKGGVAFVMENEFGFKLPKEMHPDFGRKIQKITDRTGNELSPNDIWKCFKNEYLEKQGPCRLVKCNIQSDSKIHTRVEAVVKFNKKNIEFNASGNGPIDAFVNGFRIATGIHFTIDTYQEHAIEHGSNANAVAYIGIRNGIPDKIGFGAGLDANISIASIKAVVSAINQLDE